MTLYVLEWSFKQRCFHIDLLADSLAINLAAFREMRPTEYIPLAIYSSRHDASAACERLRPIVPNNVGAAKSKNPLKNPRQSEAAKGRAAK